MISTQRLLIKPWVIEDASEFYELTKDDGFNLYPITIYRQASLETAREWIQKAREVNAQTGLGKWAAWTHEGKLLGLGGLTPWQWEGESLVDITYRLRSSAWGQGLGLELAKGLVEFGFEQGLKEITATITPDNEASKKIALKLGMQYDRHITLLGVPTDLYRLQYSL